MNSFVETILDMLRPPSGTRLPGPQGLFEPLRAVLNLTGDFLGFLRRLDAAYSGSEMSPVGFNVMNQAMCLVVHPAQIKEVLVDNSSFTRTVKYMNTFKAALGRNIITAPDDEWRSIRKRTAGYFDKAHLERYGDIVVEVLQKKAIPLYSEKARLGEDTELFEDMLDIASIAVFMSFLGDAVNDPPKEVYRALNKIFCYVRKNVYTLLLPPPWVPTPDNQELHRNLALVRGYLTPRLALDREKDTVFGDIIRTYTDARGVMDARKILDETIANLVGGSETTIILMAWALYYILQYPEVEEKLKAEIDAVLSGRAPSVQDLRKLGYLQQVIQETLRLRPPAWVSSRRATRDVELGGFTIRRDTMMLVCQLITHQDPRVWESPGGFRPERFAAASPEAPGNRRSEMPFFPFGGGNFYCIGMNFAINEAALMIVMLLQHFQFRVSDRRSFASIGVDARLTLRPDGPVRARVELQG